MQCISSGGMTAEWERRSDRLVVRLDAPDDGWVLFGVNDKKGLDGAWLLMATVDDQGRVALEEHRAAPPNHARIDAARPVLAVKDLWGRQSAKRTEVKFSIPLSKKGGAQFDLDQGPVEVILAYSMSDDLQHHSRHRRHFWRALVKRVGANR